MASTAIDLIITYRIIRTLVLPFDKTDAFKRGIIDADGKVLRKARTLSDRKAKSAYTLFHRFVFNLKRILKKVGLGSRLGSFAAALAILIKEDNRYAEHKSAIEQGVITVLKEMNVYDDLLEECQTINEDKQEGEPFITAFGFDVYEVDGKMVAEGNYAETL